MKRFLVTIYHSCTVKVDAETEAEARVVATSNFRSLEKDEDTYCEIEEVKV